MNVGRIFNADFGLFYIPLLDNQILNVHPCGPSRMIYSGSPNIEEPEKFVRIVRDIAQSSITQ